MDTLWQDLKYSLRALRKAPGFTATAVLTLGLGLGASVAVFSIVNAIYFAPLPYRDLDRLVMIETSRLGSNCAPVCLAVVSPREVAEWRQSLTSVDAIAGVAAGPIGVATPSGWQGMNGAAVSAALFPLLGLRPILGRALIPADEQPGAPNVVVLSHRYWIEHYAGDSSVVGRSLTAAWLAHTGGPPIEGKITYQIVGVMPPSAAIGRPIYHGNSLMLPSLFLPIRPHAGRNWTKTFRSVLAHLKPAATPERVRAQLDAIIAPPDSDFLRQVWPKGFTPTWKTRVTRLREVHAREFASVYPLMFGTVLLVMLIACANLGALFLARWSARRQEVMVRTALGAGRGRLVRQFVTEGMMISAAAVGVAFLIARWSILLTRLVPLGALPYWTPVAIDMRVAGFAVGLAAVCGLTFALLPAAVLTRSGGSLTMRDSARAVSGSRSVTKVRRILVGAEIACTLVLLTGAGLLAKTFVDAATTDLGFARRSVLSGEIGDRSGEGAPWTSARRVALADQLLDRLKGLPGVVAASVEGNPADTSTPGIARANASETGPAGAERWSVRAVTPDHFAANGRPLLKGRVFTDADNASSIPVGIVDKWTADHFFPAGRAVGQRLRLGGPSSSGSWMTIVGVVTTWHCATTVACTFGPTLFRPVAQAGLAPSARLGFDVRTRGPYGPIEGAIRAAVPQLESGLVVKELSSIESWQDLWMAPLRVNAAIIGAFALFALILASLGTYGVLAYLVTQRTSEIGIRLALGATTANVRSLVLRSVMGMVVAGVIVGALASFGLTRLLKSMLYGTSPTDPTVFAVAVLTLLAAALVAAYLPARRAMRIDPMTALRIE